MKFYPTSRYISVLPNRMPQKETSLEMFDDHVENRAEYVLCKVLTTGPDVNKDIVEGQLIAVEQYMLREMKVDDESFWVVLDNYVVGRFEE